MISNESHDRNGKVDKILLSLDDWGNIESYGNITTGIPYKIILCLWYQIIDTGTW